MTEQASPAPFRIGGIYRQNNGTLVQLETLDREIKGRRVVTTRRLDGDSYNGARFLDNGRYCYGESDHDSALQPGELNDKGEPIAPTFHCAAETLNPPEPVADECAEPEKRTSTAHDAIAGLTRIAPTGHQVHPSFGSAWLR